MVTNPKKPASRSKPLTWGFLIRVQGSGSGLQGSDAVRPNPTGSGYSPGLDLRGFFTLLGSSSEQKEKGEPLRLPLL